jgi:hypothetical protein
MKNYLERADIYKFIIKKLKPFANNKGKKYYKIGC